jgi:xanthine dehydrogenase accessory factor
MKLLVSIWSRISLDLLNQRFFMRDILTDIERWQNDGESIALATVIQTWGSAPRKVGSCMALTASGKIVGSVSGGCVENAVVEAGLETLKTNRPQLLHFGVADETAWEVGLACGGSIDIFVQPLDAKFFEVLKNNLTNETPVVHALVVRGAKTFGQEALIAESDIVAGSLGNEWDSAVLTVGIEALYKGNPRREPLSDSLEVFYNVILPSPTLIIVGGVHIAIPLVSLAKTLGFRVVLIDPRKFWANAERFANVDELIQEWIEPAFARVSITRSTAIVMLTHDPKLDDPAVRIALNSPAYYVGALGSKTTNEKRRTRLLNDGVSESQLARLRAPIGLDIGASTPEEIALAIMSEVVKSYRKQNQPESAIEAKQVQSPISSL